MPKSIQGLLVQLVPLSNYCTNGILKVGTNGRTVNAPNEWLVAKYDVSYEMSRAITCTTLTEI